MRELKMAKPPIMSKEAREYVNERLQGLWNQGELKASDVVELIRPFCSFDPVDLFEEELERLTRAIVRSIRDERGARKAFFVQNEDTIIDIETCQSREKVAKVERQLFTQWVGLSLSHRRTLFRRQELEPPLGPDGAMD